MKITEGITYEITESKENSLEAGEKFHLVNGIIFFDSDNSFMREANAKKLLKNTKFTKSQK